MSVPEEVTAKRERRAQNSEDREDRELLATGVKELMSTKAGRRLVWWLLELSGIDVDLMSDDTNWTAFRLGERNLGLRLRDLIWDTDMELWLVYLKEMSDVRRVRNQRREHARRGSESA